MGPELYHIAARRAILVIAILPHCSRPTAETGESHAFLIPSKLEMQKMGRRVILAGLMLTWHKLESSDRREPQMRKFLHKIQL